MLAGRSAQAYEKWSFCSIFNRLGTLPQVFGQVKEWLKLKLHEMIKVLHVVVRRPIAFLVLRSTLVGRSII